MLDRLGDKKITPEDEKILKRVLFGEAAEVMFSGLRPMNEIATQVTRLRGKVAGGNLATLASCMGTPFQTFAKGKIVVFEEIGERAHQVDRLLMQLTLSGYFKGARGVVFGEFLGGKEPATGVSKVPLILQRFANESTIPVFQGMPIGHGVRQKVLPLNTSAELTLEKKRGKLKVLTGSF